MKVYFFPFYATVDTSFGTDLELIQLHIDRGDDVSVFTCSGGLIGCDRNRTHEASICETCISQSNRGLSLLKGDVKINQTNIEAIDAWKKDHDVSIIDRTHTIADLKAWEVDNFDIGYAILSSLISWKKDAEIKISEHAHFLKTLAQTCLKIYHTIDYILDQDQADLVYVFNGRYAPMRAVVRACEKNSIDFYTHDRGCDLSHYQTFLNSLPHNRELYEQTMRSAWNNAEPENRLHIGAEWFEKKSEGYMGAFLSFTDKQDPTHRPENWDPNKKNITIFSSSQYESIAIGKEWENLMFKNQLEGIKYIIEQTRHLKEEKNIEIYIRMHPNQIVSQKEIDLYLELDQDVVRLIFPDSKVSTYELIKDSDVVLTFGSTVGIEATFWGTTSIMIGYSYYTNLDVSYNPKTKEELISFLLTDLPPKPKSNSLMYGYWQAIRGIPYKHYEPTGFFNGNFNGQSMRPPKKKPAKTNPYSLPNLIRRIISKSKNVLSQN